MANVGVRHLGRDWKTLRALTPRSVQRSASSIQAARWSGWYTLRLGVPPTMWRRKAPNGELIGHPGLSSEYLDGYFRKKTFERAFCSYGHLNIHTGCPSSGQIHSSIARSIAPPATGAPARSRIPEFASPGVLVEFPIFRFFPDVFHRERFSTSSSSLRSGCICTATIPRTAHLSLSPVS